MPELKHNFLKGRMNKDLDERLLPNGEYRHALNVEVGTSEGGDSDGSPTNVGSLQTIMGNNQLSNLPFSGTCVGSIADEKNDTLYWFVSSQSIDVIAVYDQRTGNINPVVVDNYGTSGNPRALNFNANNLITGINIIDDMLFWTDNLSEPKKINIPKSIEGSNPASFTQHTTYVIEDPINPGSLFNTGILIQEKHITVIKENPVTAPVLEMKNTSFTDRIIEGQIIGAPDGDFTDGTGAPLEIGSTKNDVDMIGSPDLHEGDIILLTSTGVIPEKSIRAKVTNVVIFGLRFDLEIITIHTLVGTTDINWNLKLEQRESFFDFKFPRFAYRYKYDDGEYSAFGPFSEVAFLPGKYDYQPKKGFNLGMVNQVRHLAIKDFVPEQDLLPDGVIAIDILYKESNSPNVYTVKTVKPGDIEWDTYRDPLQLNPLVPTIHDPARINTKGFLEIESEMIHAVLPSNQALRPWDNVPRRALAQEVTGNRLVYGNYLQNYNVHNSGLSVGIDTWRSISGSLPEEILPEQYESYKPAKSIKSLRTYQLGVVFRDIYGRETPVFSDTADQPQKLPSVFVEKQHADNQNQLTAVLTEPPPPFADSFKFFVKETSNEYYNLSMDRWYDAQDDNLWLSFPSSERNKVDIETFLILKKARDSNVFVADPARYKILAIENEAPQFIKTEKQSHGTITDNAAKTNFGDSGGAGFPLENYTFIYVNQTPWQTNKWDDTLTETANPLWVRMKSGSSISQWYRITSIAHDTNVNCYKIILKNPLKVDVAFTSTNNSFGSRISGLVLEIMEEKVVDKPEFEGRFFVKVHKDITLMNHIVKTAATEDLWVVVMAKSVQYCSFEHAQKPNMTLHNSNVGWHDGSSGSHQTPDWGNVFTTWQCSGSECIMGGQGIASPSFFNTNGYEAFGHVTDASNTAAGELDRYFLLWDGDYSGAVSNIESARRNGSDFWEKFSKHSSGWFIDGWLGLQHGQVTSGSGWHDCDPGSGGGVDQDMFPESTWGPGKNGRGIRHGSNRIELSFHRAGKRDTFESNWPDQYYSEDTHDWGSTTGDKMSIFHTDTASEALFKERLTTPGTLWRWAQDPDRIIHETTADRGFQTYFNYSYPCDDGGMWWTQQLSGDPDALLGPAVGGYDVIDEYGFSRCRRQRYSFNAKVFEDPNGVATWNIGEGKYGYLPTNDPRFTCINVLDAAGDNELVCFPHLMWNGLGGAPANPKIAGVAFVIGNDPNDVDSADNCSNVQDFNPNRRAPGIRSDGMPSGYDLTSTRVIGSTGEWAGTVSWEIVESATFEEDALPPTNPAVWETEPKEDVGLDIYHEIGQVYPVTLDEQSNEQYIPIGSTVECWRPGGGGGTIVLGNASWTTPIRVAGHNNNEIFLVDATGIPFINNTAFPGEHILPLDRLQFRRADGSATSATVDSTNSSGPVGVGDRYGLNPSVWGQTMRLPWFNCYSFGNGIESDRIRDDFNQITIDNGPKASTTLDEPYLEERRGSGFIWSGIYNSISGVNNLNQFIQAEPITKDLNPSYGSIQKIFSRNTDLVTFCEDKVLKVLANKDALFNADGSTNVTASNNVLGQTTPFAGEFGISTNPESFANEAYRLYFSDVSRGVTCRLSQNGITPISEAGMQDWFADKLPQADKVIGSFDDKKQEYNVSLLAPAQVGGVATITPETLSFSETSKGWTSFKSFVPENGISFNNDYYTFSNGQLYQHHINQVRNNFYGRQFDSSVNVLFNDIPGSVKSFNTLNYEGTQSRITLDLNDPEYYNNTNKTGWYVDSIYTNLQEINEDIEFKSKEGKWFAQIKGEATDLGNLDTREFSVQGLGHANFVGCPNCPRSWRCVSAQEFTNSCENLTMIIPLVPFSSEEDFIEYVSDPSNGYTSTDPTTLYSCIELGLQPNQYPPDACKCSNGGILMIGSKLGFSVTNSYTLDITSYTTWDNFIDTIINDWGIWAANCPLVPGMTFSQAKIALNIWGASQVPQVKYSMSVSEPSPCTCTTVTVCDCIEVIGSGGYASKTLCENDPANCCGTVSSGGCIPCTALGADTSVPGCCDNSGGSSNYNPLATCDDGSCTPIIYGCMDDGTDPNYPGRPVGYVDPNVNPVNSALNYYVAATVENGTCVYCTFGCTNPLATNYNSSATCDDGSCILPSVSCGPWVSGTDYNIFTQDDTGACASPNNDGVLNWGTTIPNFVPGDSWTYDIVSSSGVVIWGPTTVNVSVSGGFHLITNGPDTYTINIIHTIASGGTCTYVITFTIGCTAIVTSWNCVSGTCIDPGTGSGTYPTLAACQAVCGIPQPSWNCVSGTCVDPLDGSGTHSSLAACQAVCVPESWDCNHSNGTCSDPGTGLGQYATQAACYANCWVTSWNCVNGSCVDPQTGSGAYNSLAACQSICSTPSWECSGQWGVSLTGGTSVAPWTCYDPGNGTGSYATQTLCEDYCDTWDCVQTAGTTSGSCINPGNGSGFYGSLLDCQNPTTGCPSQRWACCTVSNLNYDSTCAGDPNCTCDTNLCAISTVDISWSGCIDPCSQEFSVNGPNGLPCDQDAFCTGYWSDLTVLVPGGTCRDYLANLGFSGGWSAGALCGSSGATNSFCTMPSCSATCFVAGTKITMDNDLYKNIEDIAIGDIVKSWNEDTGNINSSKVTKLIPSSQSNMIILNFGDIETKNTFDHPYYVEGKGWCSYKPELTIAKHGLEKVKQLEVNDICYKYNNGILNKITLTKIEEDLGEVQTYIFKVEKDNTFFANNILVHNK